jgi:hypothetical protein
MLTLQDAIEQIPLLKKAQDAAYKVNLACERLVAMGKFTGMLIPVKLQVYERGTVTLPGDLETMIGATSNGVTQVLHDPWFEFAPRPNHSVSPDPRYYAADLGDSHVTYRSPAGATALRVVLADSGDADAEVSLSVRRTEDEGIRADVIVTTDILGDLVAGFGGAPIHDIVKFSKPRTGGWVSLEAELNGVWTEVARFGPRDTEIRYRKYSIPGAEEGTVVVGFCKKRYRPVEELKDELPVESIYCLRMAIDALISETGGDLEKAQNFWALARKGLSDALSEHRSSALRTVPIYCRAAAGAKLRAIR